MNRCVLALAVILCAATVVVQAGTVAECSAANQRNTGVYPCMDAAVKATTEAGCESLKLSIACLSPECCSGEALAQEQSPVSFFGCSWKAVDVCGTNFKSTAAGVRASFSTAVVAVVASLVCASRTLW